MSDTTDPELCSLITNVCEPPKTFDFWETGQSLKSLYEFAILGWKKYCLPCVLFSRKNVWKSLQKTISKLTNSSKSIQKHQNLPTGTHKKRLILFHRFLGEFTLFLIPPPPHPSFLKKGDENSQKLSTRGTNFLKIHQGKRGEEKENTKFVEVMEFFYFNLLIINCHFHYYCF